MATNRNNNNSTIGIDFIGVLFAMVIGISGEDILTKEWFAPGPFATFQPIYLFNILTLVLGYSTVILSWLGYQRMIRVYPHKLETPSGFFTFVVDILLLACYLLILVKFENFGFVLLMLVMVYWLYVLWDRLHWQQYAPCGEGPRSEQILRRLGVTRFWAIVFTLTFVTYWQMGLWDGSSGAGDALFLILAYLFTISYRYLHIILKMKWILNFLTLQWLRRFLWLQRIAGA
jgi:hypothetical protein